MNYPRVALYYQLNHAFYFDKLSGTPNSYTLVDFTGLPEGESQISITTSSIVGMPPDLEIKGILYPDNGTFSVEIDREIKRTIAVETRSLSGYKVAEGSAQLEASLEIYYLSE